MPGRFILIASSRKGTHLLTTALARHPDIVTHDQWLSLPDFHPEKTGPEVLDLLFDHGENPVLLPLDWSVGRTRYNGLWESLRDRSVGVIHLHRRNMLRWYVSILLAKKTDRWSSFAKIPYGTTVEVDPKEFIKEVLWDWRNERKARVFFEGHRQMHLWYEDLTNAFGRWMQITQRFIGVDVMPLQPYCHKQQGEPLQRVIANFDALAEAWHGTPLEAWLWDETCREVEPNQETTL